MAKTLTPRHWRWLIPTLIVLVGAGAMLVVHQMTRATLAELQRDRALGRHLNAEQQLGVLLQGIENGGALLANAAGQGAADRQGLAQLAAPLLQGQPWLVTVERYRDSVEGWHQLAPTAQDGFAAPPTAPAPWQNLMEQAWSERRPMATPLHTEPEGPSPDSSLKRRVRLFWPVDVPEPGRELLALVVDPGALLAQLATGATDPIHYQLFDLNSQSIDPLVATANAPGGGAHPDLESRLALADRTWLLRSGLGSEAASSGQRLLQFLLLTGAVLTLAAALLGYRLTVRLQAQGRNRARTLERLEEKRQALHNLLAEKRTLNQALYQSRQRLRDFIELGDAFCVELDEHHRIGTISPQIASFVDRAPAELEEWAFTDLIPPAGQERFLRLIMDNRQEGRQTEVATQLLRRDGSLCPVTLRLQPVCDGLGQYQGHRLVGWHRRPERSS